MKYAIAMLCSAGLLLIVGCRNRVVFTTQTSLGLDVSGTAQLPNKVSMSYNRFEAALVPRKTNGEAHTVYGGMDADVKFFEGHTIKQTFATGKAAMLATGAPTNGVDFPGARKVDGDHPLVFLTATTFGLHLTVGEKEMSPNLLLGYRRSEAAVIPVPEPAQEVRSVYADILINSSANTNNTSITTNFSALRGVRIKQSFATGRAADSLAASNPQVRAKLDQAAGVEATKQSLRELKAKAADIVDQLKAELDRLNDNLLPNAVAELKKAGVLEATDLQNPERLPPRDLCRRIKRALLLKIGGPDEEFADPETVQQLQDALARLRQLKN